MEQVRKKVGSSKKQSSSKHKKVTDKRLPPKQKVKRKRSHPKFGTSKAEINFAKNFLDKLGVRYIWQYEMVGIGRYMDYFLPDYYIGIEYDGEYYHSDPRVYKEEDLTPMQKRNRRVDEQKDRWALLHSMPLIRVREKDVREHPDKVMQMLREKLNIQGKVIEKKKEMEKRHTNKLSDGLENS